jgi:hypothetical protein
VLKLRPRPRLPRDSGVIDRSRAVVAWRFWGLGKSETGEVRLLSPYRETEWQVDEPLSAECFGPQLTLGHWPPSPGARRALPLRRLRRHVFGSPVISQNDARASVVVTRARAGVALGTVIAENDAWRASFAYPERLLVPTFVPGAFTVAEELEAYGVPVAILDVRDMYTALHPAGHAPFIPSG